MSISAPLGVEVIEGGVFKIVGLSLEGIAIGAFPFAGSRSNIAFSSDGAAPGTPIIQERTNPLLFTKLSPAFNLANKRGRTSTILKNPLSNVLDSRNHITHPII